MSGFSVSHRFMSAMRQIAVARVCSNYGHISAVEGIGIILAGFSPPLGVGENVHIPTSTPTTSRLIGEVVRVSGDMAWMMPNGVTDGLAVGIRAQVGDRPELFITSRWIGRVISSGGLPIDGKGPLDRGSQCYALRRVASATDVRRRLGPAVSLGVRALDIFTTVREGQRLGIFAASGVGKSTLLAMIARNCALDIMIICLVGERRRELREFLEDNLEEEGLARSIVFFASSDEPPINRINIVYLAMTVAEYFRNAGKRVLFLIDSVSRFALASREIGLSAGELPATRGYPPSVFAKLPQFLERAGPGPSSAGSITAIVTVLVEGDDHDEPIADSVRGIVDGHVILDRGLAERGQFPPISVLRSLSRTVPGCQTQHQAKLAWRARHLLARHNEIADIIRLGGYREGADPEVDRTIRLSSRILACINQPRDEVSSITAAFQGLEAALMD